MAIDEKFADQVGAAFGEALRQTRNGRKISQEALALESGLDRTYVSLLERGKRQPTLAAVFLLASTLDTDPVLLVKNAKARLDSNQG
jgi:transcriptional regulator with XRE-family HTH domain